MASPSSLIVFDLDHALYFMPPNVDEYLSEAKARAAKNYGFSGSIEEARKISQYSRAQFGSDLTFWTQVMGYDHRELDRLYHLEAIELFVPHITPALGLRDVFHAANIAQNTVLLTHGTSDWADAVLKKIELDDIFPADKRFPIDHPHIDYTRKDEMADERSSLVRMAQKFGVDFKKMMLVDDTTSNLDCAHALGMGTLQVIWDGVVRSNHAAVRFPVAAVHAANMFLARHDVQNMLDRSRALTL